MQLNGKTALVTGASSGIGKSFAHLLAGQGTDVILVARSQDKLTAIAVDIQNRYGISATVIQQDLGKPGAAKELFDQVQAQGLDVDLLINNAGFGKWGGFNQFSLEEYQQMIQLNITALTELCYLFLPLMKDKSEAGIINVGSTASLIPVPYSAVYAATKSYVLFLSEGLVGELEGSSVKVHCLCPAGTDTNFANVASDGREQEVSSDMKTPDEVAKEGLAAFLADKHYVVTGRKFSIWMTRFLSRRRVVAMVANMWRKRLAGQ